MGTARGRAQGVAMGKDGGGLKERAALTVDVLADKSVSAVMGQLQRKFSPNVVLRGCHAARGESGEKLMLGMSKAPGVPVKGSDWYQIVGRSDLAGNIITATPSGTPRRISPSLQVIE